MNTICFHILGERSVRWLPLVLMCIYLHYFAVIRLHFCVYCAANTLNGGTFSCDQRVRCRAQRLKSWIKSSFEMDRVVFHHSFWRRQLQWWTQLRFPPLRMRKRSNDWWEQIVQKLLSEWLANFRVRLLPRGQDSLTNENTEYWVHTLLAEIWPPTVVLWHHIPSHFDWSCVCVYSLYYICFSLDYQIQILYILPLCFV